MWGSWSGYSYTSIRAHQRGHHHQPQLLGMVKCVWRRQDDHSVTKSADTPLPHRRNGQRVLRRQHSTLAAQTKMKSRKSASTRMVSRTMNRFDLHHKLSTACLHAVEPDSPSTRTLLLSLSTNAVTKISNPPWINFQSAGCVSFQSARTLYLLSSLTILRSLQFA